MNKGLERHMFPGNNTGIGFFSYYEYILPQRDANHIYCLKGGPGVGKSTFMKRIAQRLQSNGYDIEYMHCSSDPQSLDGIVIPLLQVAIVDGTAPHVIDPKTPGAVDEILSLGEYWDAAPIKACKDGIMQTAQTISELFGAAYQYLSAARILLNKLTSLHETATEKIAIDTLAKQIMMREINEKDEARRGKVRKLFASAITPLGVVNHVDTLCDGACKVFVLKSRWGAGVSVFLERIVDEAQLSGLDIEAFYSPMEPASRIEHVFLPQLNLAFVTENESITIEKADYHLDLTQYIDEAYLNSQSAVIDFDAEQYKTLLNQAVLMLGQAKQKHDDLEAYYVPHMDFEKMNQKLEEVYSEILQYADSKHIENNC